jgi:hypothetical protein
VEVSRDLAEYTAGGVRSDPGSTFVQMSPQEEQPGGSMSPNSFAPGRSIASDRMADTLFRQRWHENQDTHLDT